MNSLFNRLFGSQAATISLEHAEQQELRRAFLLAVNRKERRLKRFSGNLVSDTRPLIRPRQALRRRRHHPRSLAKLTEFRYEMPPNGLGGQFAIVYLSRPNPREAIATLANHFHFRQSDHYFLSGPSVLNRGTCIQR